MARRPSPSFRVSRCLADLPLGEPEDATLKGGALFGCPALNVQIIGTWHGPAWSSAQTISSVLLSIQSLMGEHPYHNEPGFEQVRRKAALRSEQG